ncbi:MAG: hypothetical protein LBG80_10440 [Bacteroidales bacterium]|jgi:beta-galactosidase/beta-glucuronidase|nr:hypothetical protein [Bacteroidales bacterium]
MKKYIVLLISILHISIIELRESDGFYLNETKIMFKGVCRHTFTSKSGQTSIKKLVIEDVNLMKDMNLNAVRKNLYPPDLYFLAVCDSLGMLVIDKLANWQKKYEPHTTLRLVKSTVIRDVYHPCVGMWANGNEGGYNKEARQDYSLYDSQNRIAIEPVSKANGTDTKHYPRYNYVHKQVKIVTFGQFVMMMVPIA